jgi:hypothetical protein
MRAALGTVLLFLLNLQPLAGAALCQRHHTAQHGAACVAGMQMETHDASPGHAAEDDGGMAPMAEECAAAIACAAPAPVVAGTILLLDFAAPLAHAEIWPRSDRPADTPAVRLFRPPIA